MIKGATTCFVFHGKGTAKNPTNDFPAVWNGLGKMGMIKGAKKERKRNEIFPARRIYPSKRHLSPLMATTDTRDNSNG